jgi:hypothetical protein
MADEEDIISREDLNSNKNIFMEQQLYAMKIADVYNSEVKKRLTSGKKFKAAFPSAESLYNKDLVREMDPIYQKNKIAKKKYFAEDNKTESPKHKINTIIEKKAGLGLYLQESSIGNETTSTSSKDDTTLTLGISLGDADIAKSISEQVFKDNSLFTNRDRSRFDFTVNSCDRSEGVEIPKFIKDLIFKKVSRHKLTKNIKNSEDILYCDTHLENEYQSNNPWAQFIIENKTFNDDWEFVQDFDYINTLILKK